MHRSTTTLHPLPTHARSGPCHTATTVAGVHPWERNSMMMSTSTRSRPQRIGRWSP